MAKKIIKNFSLFSNSGIGEYGTNNIKLMFNSDEYTVHTVVANELLKERAEIFSSNYPNTNMINGSITDKDINNLIISEVLKNEPISASFSPPCQGSSGLNAFKNNPFDFRNQLVKSVFKIFEGLKDNNSLQFGYLENVVSFYSEEIPALLYKSTSEKGELFNDYVITKEQEYLNYQYFILTDTPELFKNGNIEVKDFELIDDEYYNSSKKKFSLGFNKNDINLDENDLRDYIFSIDNEALLISPISIIDYLQSSFKKYGYNSNLQFIRGEEFGGCQIRQRGFLIFYRNDINITFPETLFNKSKDSHYNGKTILDSFKTLNLIEIIESEEEFIEEKKNEGKKYQLMLSHPYKKVNGKVYIDTSITEEQAEEELLIWNKNNCPNNNIPNLHFRSDLKDRFRIWLENTKEGSSAYKNIQRIHRPYKLIEVIKKSDGSFVTKGNQVKVVEEDSIEYFEKERILDYIHFVTDDMKQREGNKEWGSDSRKWMIRDIKDRKKIEESAIQEAKNRLMLDDTIENYYIFMPIKGFEAATYKRATLNGVSAALTTKNGIGNSNTCHPIFNRTWTPKEYMAIFGIGYILNENLEYEKSKEYIPPKNIKKIKTFSNLIFEIHGEAIISTVAEQIMKSMITQYLEINNSKS